MLISVYPHKKKNTFESFLIPSIFGVQKVERRNTLARVQCIFFFRLTNISEFQHGPYGEFHPGRELTAIELEKVWFAVKPISMWIFFKLSVILSMCQFF